MAAAETKSVRESEQEAQIIFLEDDDKFLDQQLTREQWDKILADGSHQFLGIAWEARIDWLKANNYEITRPNLRDAHLPSLMAQEAAKQQ